MRQLTVNEPDINLRYIYFLVYLIDGRTPALDEIGGQPQININGAGWQSTDIGLLEDAGYGNYRALLGDNAIDTVGNIILSHYETDHTSDTQGESVQIVQSLSQIPIFEDPSSPPTILTYVSLPEAEQYFATRLASDSWTYAKQQDKVAALNMATRDIDQLNFIGRRVDPQQPLAFPRDVSRQPRWPNLSDPYKNVACAVPVPIIIYPTQIKMACCEIAYNYLDGIEIEAEMNRLLVDQQQYTGVNEVYRGVSVNEAKRAGINSNRAWIYLKPYLVDGYGLKLVTDK